jgi:hypothetical protein
MLYSEILGVALLGCYGVWLLTGALAAGCKTVRLDQLRILTSYSFLYSVIQTNPGESKPDFFFLQFLQF